MTLFRIPEKYKAMLVMLAMIISSLHTIASALIKIFDDNELSLDEAVRFSTGPAKDVVGKWRGVNSPDE